MRYALDKDNAKLLGVCSGFARWADVDPTLVRVTFVLLALFAGPIATFGYVLTGMVAADHPRDKDARAVAGATRTGSPRE